LTLNNKRDNIPLLGWTHRLLWAMPFAAPIILIALAAACSGGSASPGVADVDSTPTPGASSNGSSDGSSSDDSTEPSNLAFAQCMRDHGITNFPDPTSEGDLEFDAGALGLLADSPQFQAADEACKKYLPNGGQPPSPDPERRDAALKFSQCMRDEGISRFPDPNLDGTIDIEEESGVDPDSPQVQAASEACRPYLGGDEGIIQ